MIVCGVGTRGIVGIGQAPDLHGLGLTGNDHAAIGDSQGPQAWCRRQFCQRSDPRGIPIARRGS